MTVGNPRYRQRAGYLARSGLLLLALAVLASCGSGKNRRETEIRGERLPVLIYEQQVDVDESLAQTRVALPEPYANADWPQAGGSPGKAMHQLALPAKLSRAWSRGAGMGDSINSRLTNTPVIADGRLYMIDARSEVRALSASSGKELWSQEVRLAKENKQLAFGGGIAAGGGMVYVASGYGLIAALDGDTGREKWRVNMGIPLRSAPTLFGGRLFVVSLDNQLFALSQETGETQWESAGIVEDAGLMGAAAPAAGTGTLVVGYSSGELTALQVENGLTTWQDSLARRARLTALAALSDIDGSPVIDRGRVFAISHSGRLVSLDLASGRRLWEQNIGGTSTPWVAGDYLYVVSSEAELFCITRTGGRVRWVTQLQRYKDPDDRKGLVRWQGPVLASDRLILTSSNGYVATLSPYTGDLLSLEKISDGSFLPPIVADNSLYVVTRDADIVAYR